MHEHPIPDAGEPFIDEPGLQLLILLCIEELHAVEVWLFGSRARGDHHPDSDWDILAVVPDDAPKDIDNPISVFRVRRKSGLHADLLTVRQSDFMSSKNALNTISHEVAKDGILLSLA